jgi:linoleoyl-CoA desaturase
MLQTNTAYSGQLRGEGKKQKASQVRFDNNHTNNFYPELTRRVNQYFKDNNLKKSANGKMIIKTVFILFMFVGSYLLILSNLFPVWGLLILAIVNGFFTAQIGLNIAHDAIHGSYSGNEKVNKTLAVIFNIIGANDEAWKVSHNLIHHTYTNIPHHDLDIEQIPVIRLNPKQDLWKIHRYQHFYTIFLYALTSLSWVFLKDYVWFFGNKEEEITNKKSPVREKIRLVAYKLIYYGLFLALPLVVINLPWYYILTGFLILHLVEGITLALIFQLAHVIEGTSFPEPNHEGLIENSWAAHQMYTTADFARKNKLANFLFGGLNFQIEHHLFPKVCHIHYQDLSPIVKATAEEYNLPYIDHPTFFGAVRSHIRMLKKLGQPVAA